MGELSWEGMVLVVMVMFWVVTGGWKAEWCLGLVLGVDGMGVCRS